MYASSVAFVKAYRLGLTARFQVALNKCYLWRHRIRGFLSLPRRRPLGFVTCFLPHGKETRDEPQRTSAWEAMDFLTRELMLMLLYLAAGRLQDVCLSRIWVSNRSSSLQSWSLLSLTFESYSLLGCLLALWVASYLTNSYCVLRADMYLHYFVAQLASAADI